MGVIYLSDIMDMREEICDKYFGVNIEDLSVRFPNRSCVICYHNDCNNYGSKKDTCNKFKYISPEDWLSREIIILD